MKNLLIISLLLISLQSIAGQPVRTKSKNGAQVENGARLISCELIPITKRTYKLETKRKGSTEGYKVTRDKSGRIKYFKIQLIIK